MTEPAVVAPPPRRRKEVSQTPRKMTPDVVELIEKKLMQERWSPD
jgi:hypothetical protein